MSLPSYNVSVITAVGKAQQGFAAPKFIMGGKGGSGGTTYTVDKKGTSYTYALWRSEKYKIGENFKITRIKVPLGIAIAANMTIIPVVYFDDEASNAVGTTINSTNYSDSEKMIYLSSDNFSQGLVGQKNFYIEFQVSGSALCPISFPIKIEVEILEKA